MEIVLMFMFFVCFLAEWEISDIIVIDRHSTGNVGFVI